MSKATFEVVEVRPDGESTVCTVETRQKAELIASQLNQRDDYSYTWRKASGDD